MPCNRIRFRRGDRMQADQLTQIGFIGAQMQMQGHGQWRAQRKRARTAATTVTDDGLDGKCASERGDLVLSFGKRYVIVI